MSALAEPVALRTGLPGPVTLRRLTTADAAAFAGHVARDLERLGEHLPSLVGAEIDRAVAG